MSRTLIDECQDGNIDAVKHMITNGANIEMTGRNGITPLFVASVKGHLEIVEVLIAHKANFLYKNSNGKTPLDYSRTDEIQQFIMNHPWYRRQPLIVTRPHADHETNKKHKLTRLGEIITATPGSVSDPNSQVNLLFQLKIHVGKFL